MKTENYYISVSEPWDFSSPDGQNLIKGNILKKLSAMCIIFKSNYLLEFNEVKGNILILSPRHYGSDFDDFKEGKDFVTINGDLLLTDMDNGLNEQKLKENSKFVIIGALEKN